MQARPLPNLRATIATVSMIVELAGRLGLEVTSALEHLRDGAATKDARAYRWSWRSAFIAGTADHRMRSGEVKVSGSAVDHLPFPEFADFCHKVWESIGNPRPLFVSEVSSLPSQARDLLADADASARWAYPAADSLGLRRSGALAGTQGAVGYVDVQTAGQVRMVALHEIAHLLRDEAEGPRGHDLRWAETYCALLNHFLDSATALVWAFEWTWWLAKALEHLELDPDWLVDGHRC